MKDIYVKYKPFIGFLLAFLVCGIVLNLPPQPGLTPAGQKAIALLAWLLTLYATEPIPLPISSLMAVPMAVFLGLANINKALVGFSSSALFMCVGAFVMAAAMEKSRLAERCTYWLLNKIGCTAARISLGVTFANVLLAFMVPSTTARTALLLPICLGIINIALKGSDNNSEGGEVKRSKFALSLLMVLAFTNSTISAGILTSSLPNPVVIGFIQQATGKVISYADWFVYGFPPALIMTIFTWWYLTRFIKSEIKEIPGGAAFISEKLDSMGKFTTKEWKTLIIFLLVGVLWATGNTTKIDTTVSCLLGAGLFYIFGIINWQDFNKTSAFQILLIMGGGFCAVEFLFSTGAAKWIAMKILDSLGLVGASTIIVLLVLMIFTQYIRVFFQGTTKLATIFIPILIAMASALNVPPEVIAMPCGMLISGFPFLMFYNTNPNVVVYGSGHVNIWDFPKYGLPICTVAIIFYLVVAVTYWKWLGLY